MGEKGTAGTPREELLAELEGIRDVYMVDVKQFVAFLREKKLPFVEGFTRFAAWLEDEHEGKRYSPATINRKIAAARSRVRYAFKHSSHAGSLRRRHHLEDILGSVKLKKIETLAVPSGKLLDIGEARRLVFQARDPTIKLMVTFLVSTGIRVSEMLGLLLTDLKEPARGLAQVTVRGRGGKLRTIHVKKEYLERIRKYFHGGTWLFEHNGRPYSRVSVTNRIKHEALRTLGREVSAQQLRHTWAAIQIERGRGVGAVAAALGHADPGLTARMYASSGISPEEAFLDLEAGSRTDGERMEGEGGREIPGTAERKTP
jgi:integrase